MSKIDDLVGQKFSRLNVLEVAPRKLRTGTKRGTYFLCKCDCGDESVILGSAIRRGHTKSCGCLPGGLVKHGFANTPEYRSWSGAKQRCGNSKSPEYIHYGGRGIKVCERWSESFENFISDMGKKPSPKHSLDRIDVNGNYDPKNCKWSNPIEQLNNRRVKKIEDFSDDQFIGEFGRRFGLKSWGAEMII